MSSYLMTVAQTEERLRARVAFRLRLGRLMPTSGALNEIASLDGLRALAILLVIASHISELSNSYGHTVGLTLLHSIANFGFSGVFLFFVLSGFLLFLPYARALLGYRPWPSARQFYLRRALRILPLYYVVLIVLLLPDARFIVQTKPIMQLLFGMLLLQDMRADAFAAMSVIDGPFWTLAVEWQFYLLLPWIALALAKLAGKHTTRGFFFRLAGGLIAFIALGLSIRWLAATMYYAGVSPLDASGFPGFAVKLLYGAKGKYLEIFALGMAASILYVLVVEHAALPEQRRKQLGLLAGIAGIAGLVGCLLWAVQEQRLPYNPEHPYWWIFMPPAGQSWQVLGEWALGLCFAFLLIAVLFGMPILKQFFTFAPLRFIGIISYSLYVWHIPLLTLFSVTISGASPISFIYFVILVAFVVLFFGSASYYLIEYPFIRFRRAAHAAADSA